MKRNLKNFNHWIAELRDIAIQNKVRIDGRTKMTKSEVDWVFRKDAFENDFIDRKTPQEAFDNEMDAWRDAQ
jgi:hypothetical protein